MIHIGQTKKTGNITLEVVHTYRQSRPNHIVVEATFNIETGRYIQRTLMHRDIWNNELALKERAYRMAMNAMKRAYFPS